MATKVKKIVYKDTSPILVDYASNDDTGKKISTSYLPLSGGTLTGDLKLRNSATAIGSAQLTATNLTDAYNNELKPSNGLMGSISLSAQETVATVNIPAGWYNYLYIPHRDGGLDGDDFNYGTLLLNNMQTTAEDTFIITISGGQFIKCQKIVDTNDLTSYVTQDWVKTNQKYTISLSGTTLTIKTNY